MWTTTVAAVADPEPFARVCHPPAKLGDTLGERTWTTTVVIPADPAGVPPPR
jgi:hypothetical protein